MNSEMMTAKAEASVSEVTNRGIERSDAEALLDAFWAVGDKIASTNPVLRMFWPMAKMGLAMLEDYVLDWIYPGT